MRARDLRAQIFDGFFRRGFADFGFRAGTQAFRELDTKLNAVLRAGGGKRLGVGVGDDEINSGQACRDHVVDGVAARASDADDSQPRPQVCQFGQLQLDAHGVFRSARSR